MKRIRTGPKAIQGKQDCPCTGTGPRKERRHCHLCKDKDLSRDGFKEIGGHVYCPSCLRTNGL
jgi:hypothetical protein